jgi:hypothetical protein
MSSLGRFGLALMLIVLYGMVGELIDFDNIEEWKPIFWHITLLVGMSLLIMFGDKKHD